MPNETREHEELPESVEFNRPKKYRTVARLGEGACGTTVHLYDEEIECDFVAKKFLPFIAREENTDFFDDLLNRFREEAQILFRLNHPNIVRVYNFYDYAEFNTAFILMEMIHGKDILAYLAAHPGQLSRVFDEVIQAFAYLEQKEILHRDIRPQNILIDDNGTPKVIDFGFGSDRRKRDADAGKSISLNWWCDPPQDFEDGLYDRTTEVYFVGKLFERAILDGSLTDFKHAGLVRQMSRMSRNERPNDFATCIALMATDEFSSLDFTDWEVEVYRDFSYELTEIIASKSKTTKVDTDYATILKELDKLYRSVMLEEHLPNNAALINIFLDGRYTFYPKIGFETETLKDFLDLLKRLPGQKRAIVIANLATKLKAIEDSKEDDNDDDLPF